MALVMIRHRIEDFARWKKEFDAFLANRRAGGERTFRITYAGGDKNDLCLVFDWDSTANATRFLESADLAAAMSRAGVIGKPYVVVAEDVTSGRT